MFVYTSIENIGAHIIHDKDELDRILIFISRVTDVVVVVVGQQLYDQIFDIEQSVEPI